MKALQLEDLLLLKAGTVGILAVGMARLAYSALRDPTSATNRSLTRYAALLRGHFAAMFISLDVRPIVVGQALLVYGALALALGTRELRVLTVLPLVLAGPAVTLEVLRKQRIAKIEAQSDTFVLALSSALKSTPSIGDAFRSLESVVSEPLRSEIVLATKHMRLGSTFEDALLTMGRRINSRAFDTALTTVLIGQRLGGNLPATLASVGGAIRELHRLDRMSRSRMSATRTQMWVVASAPVAFAVVLGLVSPGFFDPLLTCKTGYVAIGAAVALWAAALVIGRKVLQVSI